MFQIHVFCNPSRHALLALEHQLFCSKALPSNRFSFIPNPHLPSQAPKHHTKIEPYRNPPTIPTIQTLPEPSASGVPQEHHRGHQGITQGIDHHPRSLRRLGGVRVDSTDPCGGGAMWGASMAHHNCMG